ncbi:excalibur calcium-binding domain-containing protein [Mycobacterium gordonae]|nr:excalibur calcium-binding domain-containing protein [Mycobacterium sp.]MBX9981557.1 excalibur calcium-binding domain-containing protein [Mycobacterium gordonae]
MSPLGWWVPGLDRDGDGITCE